MKKIRFTSLILGVALVLAVIAFTQNFVVSSNAEPSSRPAVGMGDLRIAEAREGFIPLTGVQSYAGMGDLNLYDARGAAGSSTRYAGMGDLHRFEAQR